MKRSDAQREICALVWKHAPGLLVSSGVRPNAGFHSQGLSLDFWSPVSAEMWEAWKQLCASKWKGGISIGIPPADMHIHVDARQYDESGAKWSVVRFIETKRWDGKSAGEVCWFPGGWMDPRWNGTNANAEAIYTR